MDGRVEVNLRLAVGIVLGCCLNVVFQKSTRPARVRVATTASLSVAASKCRLDVLHIHEDR